MAIAAMRFLTTVARGVHAGLFVADSSSDGGAAAGTTTSGTTTTAPPSIDPPEPSPTGALAQVCDAVVLPALRLRADGLELFEGNWVEYVRRDAEGADADTRRRAAAELARALFERFPRGAGALFSRAVQRLLAEAQAGGGPQAWGSKDAALHLVMALMARRGERAPGVSIAAANAAASSTPPPPPIVDIPSFFAAHVAPELASRASSPAEQPANGPGADVLAADALRFLSSFRHLLPAADLAAAAPALVALLRVEAAVVHSYAAIALERLLAPQRSAPQAAAPGTRAGPAVLSPPPWCRGRCSAPCCSLCSRRSLPRSGCPTRPRTST